MPELKSWRTSHVKNIVEITVVILFFLIGFSAILIIKNADNLVLFETVLLVIYAITGNLVGRAFMVKLTPAEIRSLKANSETKVVNVHAYTLYNFLPTFTREKPDLYTKSSETISEEKVTQGVADTSVWLNSKGFKLLLEERTYVSPQVRYALSKNDEATTFKRAVYTLPVDEDTFKTMKMPYSVYFSGAENKPFAKEELDNF